MRKQFMQRSAAKSTASSPSTPNGPPSKKARLSNGASAPATPGTSDHEILQSALAAEEKKRQEALDKAAQYTGETKWVLSFKEPLEGKQDTGLKVRQAGFAEIDAEGDSEEDEQETKPVRKQFGGGVKRAEVFLAAGSDNAPTLTQSRSPSLPKRRKIPKARSTQPPKSTTATTPRPPLSARLNAKLPPRDAHLATQEAGKKIYLHEDHGDRPTETTVFVAFGPSPASVRQVVENKVAEICAMWNASNVDKRAICQQRAQSHAALLAEDGAGIEGKKRLLPLTFFV